MSYFCCHFQVKLKDICSENQLKTVNPNEIKGLWSQNEAGDFQDISCLKLKATCFGYAPFTIINKDSEGKVESYEGLEVRL